MPRSLLTFITAAVVLTAPLAGYAYERLPRSLADLSPADFSSQVRIADDPAAEAVVFSTREGYDRARGVKGARADDVHLRAVVDRQSGRANWQVWHELVTVNGHQDITAVHYTAGGQPRTAKPMKVDHWQGECPPTDGVGMCNRFTRIGFELPETAMREIAGSYTQGSRVPWRLHFKDAAGRDVTSGIAPAEAAGLMLALDKWRSGQDNSQSR